MYVWAVIGLRINDGHIASYCVELFKSSKDAHEYANNISYLPIVLVVERRISDGE